MRTRTRTLTTTAAAIAALTLAGCSSSSDNGTTSEPAPTAAAKVDCSDQNLSQADWMAHCADKAAAPDADLHKTFGQTYTWPDGLKVTVLQAKVFTHFDKSLDEHATAGAVDFRLTIRVTNSGQQPVDLSKLSTITEGATNGGQAMLASWSDQGSPLEGRLAPGVTAVKTDDGTLEAKYGRKIVVTVQRSIDDLTADYPEFTGAITG